MTLTLGDSAVYNILNNVNQKVTKSFLFRGENMRKQISAFVAALVLTMTGCAGAKGNTDTPSVPLITETVMAVNPDVTEGLIYDETDNTWSTDDEELQKFVDIMKKEYAKSKDEKGMRILAADDKIIFIAGLNSLDIDGNKVSAYTTYDIASLSKMFTATCIFQLCEQGKLSLDDTIDKFFPEFDRGKDITVYDLLHMQAGLNREFFPENVMLNEDGSDNIEIARKYYTDGYTDEELLNGLFSSELICEPGTESNYSNAGYTLLAMIIEKITGIGYDEYVKNNIFNVCGMAHSSSMKTGDLTSVAELPEEDEYIEFIELMGSSGMDSPRTARGAGGIHSCAADMVAFDRALIGGKLINEDSLAKMFDLQLDPDNPVASMYDNKYDYGCGWELHPTRPTSIEAYWHGGDEIYYKSGNMYCKSEKYGNIYLIQLYSSRKEQTFDNMMHCDNSIIEALKK